MRQTFSIAQTHCSLAGGAHVSRRTGQTVEEENFKLLLNKVYRNRGVDFSLYRPGTLRRRLVSRLRSVRCADILDYIAYLNSHPEEYDALLDALTINVSEFFRDPETFALIQGYVIPQICMFKHPGETIRVWSAGTSQGQEAYSAAILLLEAHRENCGHRGGLGVQGIEDRGQGVQVFGTDIDRRCIEDAKKGIYTAESLKGVRHTILKKWFYPAGDHYCIADALKRVCQFTVHDMIAHKPLHAMDMVFCRNVLIYFTKPLQERVGSLLASALNPGGYLVLGRVESLPGSIARDFETVDVRERIYRKRRDAQH